ncbi:TonB-linked outer membrane protein, SusC/RagA family [Filimonas lacunae]|uniref:TonB-linked outer membrane protein, SusC/RagA family n=1 Tax=Filimonas lacunae TaxID=477680 RepID=A0A173M934_9BACT|nr:TonB-dependent receptor [Filimonas lacunae]BAV04031.1 TonB-dependent receptor [Filimonas lacunae]SIT16271.1 TonB-linked outer membrane protein, SusC/RagA family [Filimonas lacunae]
MTQKSTGYILYVFLLLACLLTLSTRQAQAQTKKITGKVTDSKGVALQAVSITISGSKAGTTTDNNGNFVISAATGATLHFSSLGYLTQSVPVGSQTNVSIILADDPQKNLADIVVVGYGTQKRSDVTGSVVSVPKTRLSQLPVTNIMQAIEGSVAGVSITTTSSVPGSSPAALVRGQNSINANSGPYIVVDGIPLSKTGGSLNDINPNDIASVEVLKDASATAIYGTNGANGVILVTTKRGTTGKAVIRYNAYTGMENMAHVLTPRNGPEYVQKYADWLKATNQAQTSPVPNSGELPNYNAGITKDWIKEATQTGIIQDHNLSISGGNADVRYFVSGEYMHQKGVVKGYQYKRISIRSNLDINVTSFLTIGTSLFFANNNYDGGRANLLMASAMSPYGQEYNANGTYKIYPMAPEQLFTNPMLGLVTDRLDRSVNANGNGYAEIKFPGVLKGLKYRLNAGYTFLPARKASYTGRLANDLIGTASVVNAETQSYTLENVVTYARDFKKHHIDFTGLYSAQQRKWIETTAGATGFVNDNLSYNNLSAGATQTSKTVADRYALNSQMGRINYTYDSRYLFTVTARRDGSSVFGSSNSKYGIFPSAAIGWNVSNERFMQSIGWINNLKLRVSHGKAGNEAIDVYKTISTDGTVRSPFNGVSTIGITPSNLGNTFLGWESTISTNLGVDFSLFASRLSGTIEVYKSNTRDLLLQRNLPLVTGYANVYDNLGKTANKGIEVTLNSKNINGKDFRWETSLNISANQNRIIDLYGNKKDDIGNKWFIGKPISVIYDYKMAGIWQTGEDASKQDPGAKAGDLKFVDVNHDGIITADSDRVVLGQTAPKWSGGITNTFHYKNWHLNIFIQTAQGMTKNNNDLTYADETGKRNTPVEVGYWTADNKNNTRPSLSYNNTRGYGYASNASYTRIKDITLSYVFSQKILDKLNIGSITLYVSGRNLHTFTNWIGWDPENNYSQRGSGDWTNNYPTVRSFVFGANISLR